MNLGGGYQIGPVKAGLSGSVSWESDYLGRTVGANASMDVADKMATPYLGYAFSFDMLGRARTPYSIFHRDIYRHTINAGSSIVCDAPSVDRRGGSSSRRPLSFEYFRR